MRIAHIFAVAAVLGSALGGCAGDDIDIERQTEIFGLVLDAETGAPLSGVRISTMPPTSVVMTGVDGAYRITDGPLLDTRYQVRAEKDGFTTGTQALTTSVQRPNEVNFQLQIVVVCSPGDTRCSMGGGTEGIETCSARGNLWMLEACPAETLCDTRDTTCKTAHTLTVMSEAGGQVASLPVEGQPRSSVNCGDDCDAEFIEGTEVTLEARPLAQSEFTGWGGACAGTQEPRCTIVMDGDQSVSASFRAGSYAVTVETEGPGSGTVTSMPMGIDCGDDCQEVFMRDSQVTLSAQPEPGSTFNGWMGDCAGTNQCNLTMDGPKNVQARFETMTQPLTVQKMGTGAGLITSEPDGIDCGSDCDEDFAEGTMVTLTASAAAGSTFEGWTGDCTGNQLTCQVTMDQARTVTAAFDGVTYPLDVQLQGQGSGTVTSNPGGIDCGADCSEPFGPGTGVTLTATPDADSDFGGWGGACAGAGTALTCDVTMDAAQTVQATFVPFYMRPLAADGDCRALFRFDDPAPLSEVCGVGPDAAATGTFTPVASRDPTLDEAYSTGTTNENRFIETNTTPQPPAATIELTVRKDGAALDGLGQAVLFSDRDSGHPGTPGVRLAVNDDGGLVLTTTDLMGATSTVTAPAGTLSDGSWYHVAATVDAANGTTVFVDGAPVAQDAAAPLWTVSSSTAWVAAERNGSDVDSIHRLNGAVDEVRVSNVVRY